MLRGRIIKGGKKPSIELPKHERLGMTHKQMQNSQAIAAHPREVEEVIKEAEEGAI